MGSGDSNEAAASEAARGAAEANVEVGELTIIGLVHVYQKYEDMPDGAIEVYTGEDTGWLPENAYRAVLAT